MTNDQDDDTINLPSLAKVVKTGTTVWEPLRSAEVAVLEAAKAWRASMTEKTVGLDASMALTAAVDALNATESGRALEPPPAARYPHAHCAVKASHGLHVWGDPKHFCGGVFDGPASSVSAQAEAGSNEH